MRQEFEFLADQLRRLTRELLDRIDYTEYHSTAGLNCKFCRDLNYKAKFVLRFARRTDNVVRSHLY
jgi:hypothetical protein